MSSMSDSGGGGRAGAELMAEQFNLKVLHAVLAVRSPRPLAGPAPPTAAPASFRRRDRWFHLPLHDPPPPPSAERLEAPLPGEPLVVDIHLAPAGSGGAGGEVVERWTVACEPWPDSATAGEGIAVNRAYKRCITLLRAVYATLRLLPAYRVFHVLRRASEPYNYEMGYSIQSFAVPFSSYEEAAMRSRRFAPVDTQLGRLVVSVQYLSSLAGFKLESSSLSSSMLSPNYAVSPAAEPMRAFPDFLTEATGSSFPQSYQYLQPPHSWSYAPTQQTRFSPQSLHSASSTPSPANFPDEYLQSPLRRSMSLSGRAESAPSTIPSERRRPMHRSMLDPMLPPPPPLLWRGERGATGSQESPSDISPSWIGDPHESLPPRSKTLMSGSTVNLPIHMATYGATFNNYSSDQSSKQHSLSFQHLKEITNSFSAEQVLRSGIFGVVYKGVLQNGELIAVNKLVASKPGFHRDFEIECHHLMKLKHQNVARVLGYSYETHKIFLESKAKPIFVEMTERLLCSEYLPKGSLDMYLSDESSRYDWQARYKIILGICNGLHYLQEETDHQPIIHLDLKPTNIFFDGNMIPKITDFGISRLFHQEQTMNTLDTNETLSYMAPEYVHGGAVTLKSDIFSLGVIILEVITGRRGFPGVTRRSSGDFIELADEILKTTLEKAHPHALEEIDCQRIKGCIQIGIMCLNLQKTKRPTIKTILEMLHRLENNDFRYSNETETSSLPHITSTTEATTSLGVTAPLLRKLNSLLPPEYRVPKPLADDIDLLTNNLEEISAALLEQSMVDVPSKMGKLWMGEVRELSYDIEEFIDNIMQRLRVTDPGRRRKIRKKHRRKLRCVQTYRVRYAKIASFAWLPKALNPSAKIVEFRSLLQEASDRYYRYLDGCTTSSRCVFTTHGKDPVLYAKAANYIVGIDDMKTKLVKWLTNKEHQQLKVVPIVGPAGVGKTTLAKQVYRELGMQFNCRAFVQASRKPDMRRLLGGILSQVQQCPGVSGSCSVQDLIDNLNEYLQDKRYIVVIDDLWETTARDILTSAFPESNNRSRIIITAEFESVALGYCDYESNNIFKMKPLGSKDSGNLFFKLVFGPEIQCPERLKDVSDMIIAKCSGLPLATICVAGLLASQQDNSELWQHVQQYLCSSLNTNSSLEETLQEVLKLSYNSIPYYLKTCLMYIGMHPEGHTIWKVDLVNQWIAEDFISATEGQNTEEVAESYFSELVDRGLIQPVEIMYNGSVLSCTVNHVLLDLIARESSEDKLITTLDYSQTITGLYSSARRLSLNFSNARYATKPKSLTLSKVRSFAFFGIIKCMPSIAELKQLRVLILKFWGDHPESMIFDLTEICLLFQLRYLKISCTADVEVKLPTEMQILRYMETLVVDASVSAVPSDIIHLPVCLRTLHYIDSGSYYEGNVFSLGELKNLHDLHITYYTEKLDEHQKRNLTAVTGLSSSIGKLVNLKSFTLSPGASDMAVYHDFSSSMSCPSVFLQSLQLLPPICIFTTLPGWLGQLRNLCTLEVAVYQLLIEDMDMLAGLSALTSLSLYVWQITTGPIVFKRGAFPAVKYFKYTCSLLSLAFQEEAFPSLQRLELSFNAHRGKEYDYFLDGIEYIISLKEIAGTIGTTGGAEKPDRIAAKSAFDDAFRKHPSFPSYNIVNIADWVEEDLSDEHSRILGKATKEDTRRFWNPYFYVTSELEHFQSFGF